MAVKSRFADKMKDIKNKSNKQDERIWSENYKEDGSYQLRLTCDMNGVRYVEYKQHTVYYKDDMGRERSYKFICPKIKGEECPVCEKMAAVYKECNDNDKAKLKLKKWIEAKIVRVANVRILENPLIKEERGLLKIIRLNGMVWPIIVEQTKSKEDTEDPEFVEGDPFDPDYGLPLFYVYKKPKSQNDMPSWKGTKFIGTVTNILGNKLPKLDKDATEKEIAEWDAKAKEWSDSNKEKIDKVLSKTVDLEKYSEELKASSPSEDEIMKKVGSYLFGTFNKTTTAKEELYNENKPLDDEDENIGSDKDDDLDENENNDTVLSDDDDMPF